MKILLVDDEVDFVETLAERLSIRGIEADWVDHAEDAIIRAETNEYQLAVLDVKMPGISGINLKKRLQDKYPKMKFIFLTGHGSEESYIAGSNEAGADYYLLKPVLIDELVEKIRSALSEREDGSNE
jgi:DNA-binding response OmpR family regulator